MMASEMGYVIRPSEIKKLVKIHYYRRVPALFFGWAGTGKSFLVREAAKEISKELGLNFTEDPENYDPSSDFLFLDIRLSNYEPTDLRGLPIFSNDKSSVQWALPIYWPRGGQGIIFFDEINHANPEVLHTLYQILLDRKVGESYRLPEGFGIFGAGNLSDEDEYLSELPAPLRNRVSIFFVDKPDTEEWLKNFAYKNNIDYRILSFLKSYPQYLYTDNKNFVYATPRSWTRLSTLISGIDDLDLIEILTAANVGEEVAAAFRQFLEEVVMLPPLEKLVERPELAEKLKTVQLYHYVYQTDRFLLEERYEVIIKLLEILKQRGEELVFVVLHYLKEKFYDNERTREKFLKFFAKATKELQWLTNFVKEIKKLNELA